MPKVFILFFFCVLVTSALAVNYFSPVHKYQLIYVGEENRIFELDHDFIIRNSARVFNDSIDFIPGKDYFLNYNENQIVFLDSLGNITLEYKIYPENLTRKFSLYQIQDYSDSTKIKYPQIKEKTFYSDTKLNISGSKTIAISFASDEDFSLDQSLFLRISGELSRNVNIEAQLSDSESPITPEGNSRELSSLDKIFLRLYGKKYEIAFGDLEMEFEPRIFMNYDPRFEGLKAGWFSDNTFEGAVAISKGKYKTVRLNGVEAKQGPYYLTLDQEIGLQVVPGSESVYLNGQKKERGSDYTIDYSEGSITFTSNNFISANSIILVKFEYSDEYYRQNMYLTESVIKPFKNLIWGNAFIYQQDDKNNPLQTDFSDHDIQILETAGDSLAWGNGAVETDPGLGNYIYNEADDNYEYVGFDSTGNYLVYFSYIGINQGDYQQLEDELGNTYYDYVGENMGSYLPLRQLVKPERKLNWDSELKYEVSSLSFKAEGILSDLDKNTYSNKNDNDNQGFAYHLQSAYQPEFDRIKPTVELSYRYISKKLESFSDVETPQDNYEINQNLQEEDSREYAADFDLIVDDNFSTNALYKITKEDNAEQDYLNFKTRLMNFKALPEITYRYLNWSETQKMDEEDSEINSKIYQHEVNALYGIGKFMVSGDYYLRTRKEEYYASEEGRKTDRRKIGLKTREISNLTGEIFYEIEQIDSLDSSSEWTKESLSSTIGINAFLTYDNNSLRIKASHREIESQEKSKYDLAEISSVNSFWQDFINLYGNYSLQNVEFYPKLREFQFVGEDQGSYDQDSLYVGFGEGDYDWIVTNIDYDNPELSIEVNASLTLNLKPAVLTNCYLRNLETKTELLILENSNSEDKFKVYFLNPSYLMQDNSTLYGRRVIRQDLWWDIFPSKLSARLSARQEWTKDGRYNEVMEEMNLDDYEVSFQYTASRKVKFELAYQNRKEEESRYKSVIALNSASLDFRYRLSNDINLNSNLDLVQESGSEISAENDYNLDSIELTETVTYFYRSKYRVFTKFSYRYNKREGSTFLSFLADKKEGNIFKWNLDIDYRLNSYTSAVLEYTGNKYPQRNEEHQLSVEIKAEF